MVEKFKSVEGEFKSVDEYLDKDEVTEYELFINRMKRMEEKQDELLKLVGTVLTHLQINERDELPICVGGSAMSHDIEYPKKEPQPESKDSEPLSTSARKINEPIAIFEKEDKKMNMRHKIEVWTDKEQTNDGMMNKIKSSITASKLDGSQQTNTNQDVNRKGIILFHDNELQTELELYFGRLNTLGFVKVK